MRELLNLSSALKRFSSLWPCTDHFKACIVKSNCGTSCSGSSNFIFAAFHVKILKLNLLRSFILLHLKANSKLLQFLIFDIYNNEINFILWISKFFKPFACIVLIIFISRFLFRPSQLIFFENEIDRSLILLPTIPGAIPFFHKLKWQYVF